MSASEASALSAVAFQLAASLDAYDEQVDELLRQPLDSALYQAVSRRMDEMRMYSATLPQLSVSWVELLIRHFEFTHALWRVHRQACPESEMQQLHQQLRDASRVLARKAAQLICAGV
jgi:hypothetical protein